MNKNIYESRIKVRSFKRGYKKKRPIIKNVEEHEIVILTFGSQDSLDDYDMRLIKKRLKLKEKDWEIIEFENIKTVGLQL